MDAAKKLTPGTLMADGTVFVGIVEIEGKAPYPLYAAPRDASEGLLVVAEATQLASTLQIGNRQDFRLPENEAEAKLLFDNRNAGALKGTFNESTRLRGSYLTTVPGNNGEVHEISFASGKMNSISRGCNGAVRYVRAGRF